MEEQKLTPEKNLKGRKIVRIIVRVIGALILFVAILALLIITPPVQRFIVSKAQNWLSAKLHTKVSVGRIYIGFPKKLVLENIYIEDLKKDTLLAAGKVDLNIEMLKLLEGSVEINQINLNDITAKVSRVLPDTVFNYQFIIDAFASDEPAEPKKNDTTATKIIVENLVFDNIRLVYKDVVTGNDVDFVLGHLDTKFQTFDLDKMIFNAPRTTISGIRAHVHQTKPLIAAVKKIDTAIVTAPQNPLQFKFKKFTLKDSYVDYSSVPDAMVANINLGEFVVEADSFDLVKRKIQLKNVFLNKAIAAVQMGKTDKPQNVKDTVLLSDTTTGWLVKIKTFRMNNNSIVYNNVTVEPQENGMDYNHIVAKGISLHADNLVYNKNSVTGAVVKGELYERSGFTLKTFKTDFFYGPQQAYLRNLLVQTPGTTLKRSADLHFASMETIQKDIGKLQLDVDLNKSRVQVKDILTFVPSLEGKPGFTNPDATFYADGLVTGRVGKMNIKKLQLSAFKNTRLDLRGTITGLPDIKKLRGDLVIRNLSSSRSDIEMLAPKGSLPSNLTLPNQLALRGSIAGSMNDVKADLRLNTSLGTAAVKGTLSNPTDSIRAKYDLALALNDVQLGTILENDTLYGPVTANFVATGTGYTQKAANAKVQAKIVSASYNRYRYHDIVLDGQIAEQKATYKVVSLDPNLRLKLEGRSNLAGKYPTIVMSGGIESLHLLPLHFTKDTMIYKGTIAAVFASTDPSDLKGSLLVTKAMLKVNSQVFPLDTMSLMAGDEDGGKFIRINTEAFSMELVGKYDLAQLGSVFQQSIEPYYALGGNTKPDTLSDYDFRFRAQVLSGPLLKVIVPTIDSLAPVNLSGHFASGKPWETNISAPLVMMQGNRVDSFRLRAALGNDSAIHIAGGFQRFNSGSTLNIFNTTLNATVAHNDINFLVNLKDNGARDKYRLGGWLRQPGKGVYTLALNPDSLLLNYDKWVIASENRIRVDSNDINIRNFTISNQGQQLAINSASDSANAPMQISFGNFRIGTITAFAKQDSALADGTINGKVVVNNIQKQPTFTSDLNVANLSFRKDTVGNLSMKVNNTEKNIFNADINLTGKGNDIAITGDYEVKPANQSLIDLSMQIRKLQMKSVEAFSAGAISRATGFITGNFDVDGTFEKPNVEGQLVFNQTGFSPTLLGSYFTIDKEKIAINNKGISFDSFSIRDSAKNELNIDGEVLTDNLTDYKLNLDVTADNFQALNSSKGKGKLFWGQFYFDTDLHVTGSPTSPKIDGDLVVNDNTKLTVVLPQDEPGVEDRAGVIRFVDMDSMRMDTSFNVALADSLAKTDVTGMDVAVNIEIKKEAELTLIVDEGNGDFLRMKGAAQLTGGVDPSGKTTLAGSYEIDEGAYELSVNLLKRRFDIQKGSKIVWLGEPTKANVNLTALYNASTAPLTLVESQLPNGQNKNLYKQKLPFQVNLILTGELMKPTINFDLLLPEQQKVVVSGQVIEMVNSRLAQLRAEPSELNKQVFALLLLNRFITENPFASSGDAFSPESAARQSVSKILTEQLNNLAADLINGVSLNFDLESSDDYTTGSRENRTDLNVSLSKDLLNDRLKVTVGSNFELEGPQNSNQKQSNIAPNVALDYMLSKDGRYMLRAYRKNEYEGLLDGYIIETGLNFILTFDYNRVRELFHSPVEKKKNVKSKSKKTETAPVDTRKAGL